MCLFHHIFCTIILICHEKKNSYGFEIFLLYLQEDELKKEGGKYAHLHEELHVLVEVYSEISDAYARLSHALSELAKFLSPVSILLPIKLKKTVKQD